ncbi:helix-turn-helix domain-containing protein [Hymenobacter arizonensis]|uniref:Helix-turn-helix domain-containing protein n=1 Tax=Hymenobacter arizonensis TaxID=1227077 RepID=A0A1I5UJI2_HYMAR|nr:helix-turn-helix domain-containing protein [Hymenobacter arizonensis]SFP95197.1 Helix-turn-helix domain-containing protein [Hymenobacter arizonensis]
MRWLWVFTGLNTLLYPPVLLAMLLPFSTAYTTIFTVCVLGLYLLTASTLLLLRPQVLYGIRSPQLSGDEALLLPLPAPAKPEDASRAYSLSEEKKQEYRARIEAHMLQQPFRRKGYGIKDLAEETAIPPHHLSAFINQEYRMNFSDFINRQRVNYIKERMAQLDWRQLTLEGLALEAGFGNRTTFFRAFVKLTGSTPSEYQAQVAASS